MCCLCVLLSVLFFVAHILILLSILIRPHFDRWLCLLSLVRKTVQHSTESSSSSTTTSAAVIWTWCVVFSLVLFRKKECEPIKFIAVSFWWRRSLAIHCEWPYMTICFTHLSCVFYFFCFSVFLFMWFLRSDWIGCVFIVIANERDQKKKKIQTKTQTVVFWLTPVLKITDNAMNLLVQKMRDDQRKANSHIYCKASKTKPHHSHAMASMFRWIEIQYILCDKLMMILHSIGILRLLRPGASIYRPYTFRCAEKDNNINSAYQVE